MSEREIFDAALALANPAERAAYLDKACAGDGELRRHLEGLLAKAAELGSFLEKPAAAPLGRAPHQPAPDPAAPGAKATWERIDPYIRRFEEAWDDVLAPRAGAAQPLRAGSVSDGPAPALDDFLPKEGPDRLTVLRELVKVEIERRRQAGTPAGPAHYLARYPELAPYLDSTQAPGPTIRASEQVGALIAGRYKLLEEIGEGGMGTVWVAEQTQPVRRKVALKLIKAGMDSKTVLSRFEAERQALALMDHPNIAKVFDGGTTENGRPFFVMEYVKGVPFTKYCDDARLSIQERLTLFMPVCHAVQHAHQKGIIHRDLKPSNILVCLYDGVPVPKVIDFGLAKAMHQPLTEHTLHTAHGTMMGTPLYMSPEQAELNNLDVDTRTDIYSLGVILYELLTGSTPLERQRLKEAAWHEMLRLIKEEEPPRPSTRLSGSGTLPSVAAQRKLEPAKLTRLVRGDLDWIVMKTLEKERGRRYETANGLARDLQNYLADEPVEATPPSRGYRLRKFARKHKKALVTTVAFAVLLIAGLVVSTLLAVWAVSAEHEADQQRIASDKAEQVAVKARDEAYANARALESNLYVAHMNLAQTDWESANLGRILDLLEPYRQPAGKRDLRGWEWYYQDRLCQLELRTLKGHTGAVGSVAFSPDGSRLASVSEDKTIKVWDLASGQELRTLKENSGLVRSLGFSPDSSRLVSASVDGTIKVWDTASGQERRTFKVNISRVRSVVLSRDASRLASESDDHTIKIWDTASGQELFQLKGQTGPIESAAFNFDGSRLASASYDSIKVWDPASGQELHTLKGHPRVVSLAFSPDGSRLASAGWDRTIKVWAASGQELCTLKAHTGGVGSVAFSSDGSLLVSASADQKIKVWDAVSFQELRTLKGHTGGVWCVAFSPDGSRLVSASADRTIKLWDATSDQKRRALKGHTNGVVSVAYSPDGSRLASASSDGTIEIWDATSGQQLRTLKVAGVLSVAFSPDGNWLVSASKDRTIKIWDTASGQKLRTLLGHTDVVRSVAFKADGAWLASGSDDQAIKVWSTASGEQLRALLGHTGQVLSVAFSPQGTRLASASSDQTIKVWDPANGQELRSLKGHTDYVFGVAFSPDGFRLASASGDQTIHVWDARPWTAELRRQRKALSLVEYLCRKFPCKEKVAQHIRADKGIPEDVQQEALDLLEVYWPRRLRHRLADCLLAKNWQEAEWYAAQLVAVFPKEGELYVARAQIDCGQGRLTEAEADLRKAAELGAEPVLIHQASLLLALATRRGLIQQWLVVGPLPLDAKFGLETLDRPQLPAEAGLRPREGEPSAKGLVWQKLHLGDGFKIDFLQHFTREPINDSVAYAVCYLFTEKKLDGLKILVGSDDHCKIYLNGNPIHKHEGVRGLVPDTDTIEPVALEAGRANVLVFKVVNGIGPWGGCIRFVDRTGLPAKGIRVSLTPE